MLQIEEDLGAPRKLSVYVGVSVALGCARNI
jgi:hypothetical protein